MMEHASGEVASSIAENCPQMRKCLRHMVNKLMRGDLIRQLNFIEKINNSKEVFCSRKKMTRRSFKSHMPLLSRSAGTSKNGRVAAAYG